MKSLLSKNRRKFKLERQYHRRIKEFKLEMRFQRIDTHGRECDKEQRKTCQRNIMESTMRKCDELTCPMTFTVRQSTIGLHLFIESPYLEGIC